MRSNEEELLSGFLVAIENAPIKKIKDLITNFCLLRIILYVRRSIYQLWVNGYIISRSEVKDRSSSKISFGKSNRNREPYPMENTGGI